MTAAVLAACAVVARTAVDPLARAEELWASGRVEPALAAALDVAAGGDDPAAARAWLLAGRIEASRHRGEQALARLRRAVAMAERTGDAATRRRATEEIGLQALVTGRPGLAVDSLRDSLRGIDATGEEAARARAHGLLGLALQNVGRHEEALEHYAAAAEGYAARGIVAGRVSALLNAGTVEGAWLGRFDRAARTFRRAMDLAEGEPGVPDEVRGLLHLNLAEALADGGRLAEALAEAERASAVFRGTGHPVHLARAASTTGKILLLGGRAAAAEAEAGRAVELARGIGDLDTLRLADLRHGRALAALGRDREALARFAEAADALERLRRDIGLEEMQVSFLRDKRETYEAWIAHLHRLHSREPGGDWSRRAWRASEAGRSRSFLDHLPRSRTSSESPGPVDAERARRLIGPGGRLIEYFFGDERVYRFTVDSGGLAFDDLGPADALADRVAFLAAALRAGEAGAAAAAALSDRLLEGVRHGADRVVVVPDGPLHGVPFSVLLEPGTAVSRVPSAGVLDRVRREPGSAPAKLLAVGVGDSDVRGIPAPRLALAEREARRVASFAPPSGRLLLTGRVTEPEVRRALGEGFDVVHFAAHARVDPEDPGQSGLLLRSGGGDPADEAADGLLSAREVAQLSLDARLVVLSGCATAGSETRPGEGVLGLGRSFLRAGAGALVVTLWDVPDETAWAVAGRLYAEAATGQPLDRAVARTRQALADLPDARAFAVVGDGSVVVPGLAPPPRTGSGLFAAGLVVAGAALVLAGLRVRSRAARRREGDRGR